MDLVPYPTGRYFGPVWFHDWRGLRRNRLAVDAVGVASVALAAAASAVPAQIRWSAVGVLVVVFAYWHLHLSRRAVTLVPSASQEWLARWQRERQKAAAWTAAAGICSAGLLVVILWMPWPRDRLSIGGQVLVSTAAAYTLYTFATSARRAKRTALELVPNANHSDVLEYSRRAADAADRAADAADLRDRNYQRGLLARARSQTWFRMVGGRPTLVLPVNHEVVPYRHLRDMVLSGRWWIVEVQPDIQKFHYATRVPNPNPLLRAASPTHITRSYTKHEDMKNWTVVVRRLD